MTALLNPRDLRPQKHMGMVCSTFFLCGQFCLRPQAKKEKVLFAKFHHLLKDSEDLHKKATMEIVDAE